MCRWVLSPFQSGYLTTNDPTCINNFFIFKIFLNGSAILLQNHKGAMMELGEGLGKLRKMNLRSGPFHQFENEISAALEFIYRTQIELAACKFLFTICHILIIALGYFSFPCK